MAIKFARRGFALAALLTATLPNAAWAATDGTMGATSTGTVAINASMQPRVQISKLSDVTFTAVDPSTGVFNAQSICVWSNTAGRKYNITASGNGTSNAFTLASGVLAPAPYTVEWNQTSGQTSGTALTTKTALTGQATVATSPTCASGASTSASLIVRISATALQSMQANTAYSGALTLVVAPE